MNIMKINNLTACIKSCRGNFIVLDNIDFSVPKGRVVGICGESGSGKTTLATILLRLPGKNISVQQGSVEYYGKDGKCQDLLKLNDSDILKIRGKHISLVYQNSTSALNPLFTIGQQLEDVFRIHHPKSEHCESVEAVKKTLAEMWISSPEKIYRYYPHQLSGGMRQRITIAMALMGEPEILIADEPTSALDTIVQCQIVKLLDHLRKEKNISIILISHNIPLVVSLADTVIIMYATQIVEHIRADSFFSRSLHPYTTGLLYSYYQFSQVKSKQLIFIPGNMPSLENLPSGCKFHPRCPYCKPLCVSQVPELLPVEDGNDHYVRCHFYKTFMRNGCKNPRVITTSNSLDVSNNKTVITTR